MDKFGKIRRRHWKKRLKINKIAKFQSDLLKSNEDTAPQSRDIFEALFSVASTVFPNWSIQKVEKTVKRSIQGMDRAK